MVSLLAKIENAGSVRLNSGSAACGGAVAHALRARRVVKEEHGLAAGLSRLTFRRVSLSTILVVWLWPGAAMPETADASLAALFADFGFDARERREVDAGEIVAIDAHAVLEGELSGAAAMRLPIPPAAVAHLLRDGLVILADRQRQAHARIDAGSGDAVWSAIRFGEGDEAEVERLERVEAGEAFNLSSAEIASVRQALNDSSGEPVDALALAAAAYRGVLAGRYLAYRGHGLRGLADYDRGEFLSSPAAELHHLGSRAVPPAVRALARALEAYPAAQPSSLESLFFWKKTIVDGRPVFVLSHVLIDEGPERTTFALREYYVGHSYNVLQQLGLVVPYGDGSLMLAVNSTMTDRIVGTFGVIARPIGRLQARDALRRYFAGIRAWSSRSPAVAPAQP